MRTIVVSRYGALIDVPRPLRLGQIVRLANVLSQDDALFRVVGPVSPQAESWSEWAVEYEDPGKNIWGIYFPAPPEGESDQPSALLECRACHKVALLRISLESVDVLKTSGILIKPCPDCDKDTPWGYTEKEIMMGAPPEEAGMIAAAQAAGEGKERRRHRRIPLQLPALIRDFLGEVEVTKTEDVSKSGLCFLSEKTRLIGQGIRVVCPYTPGQEHIEMSGRIVRRIEVRATQRNIYGVRYEG